MSVYMHAVYLRHKVKCSELPREIGQMNGRQLAL